jgi:hypothetical protein
MVQNYFNQIKITMTQNKVAKILIQTIIKELGGKLNGQEQYLDGMGTQFSFDLKGKSFSVDLWDEDVVKEFNHTNWWR